MKSIKIESLLFILTSTLTFIPVQPATGFDVQQNSSPNFLIDFLLGDTTGLSDFKVELNGDSRGFGVFEDDPFRLESGIVLSTGKVNEIVGINSFDGENPSFTQDLSTDFGTPGEDITSLVIEFDVSSEKDTLYFQYIFGSEEFIEYGGSPFNDSFEFLLNGVNLATLTDGRPATINQLFFDPEPGIESEADPYHPDFIYNPVGTGSVSNFTKIDGYTRPLLFSGPLLQNSRNRLEIKIQDVRDGIYDSAVFLKAGTLGTVKPPSIVGDGLDGALDDESNLKVPEPASSLGMLFLGGLLLTGLLTRD
ncbi:MAG: hypothetical protein F6K63_28820 [Moorea sp. SIO1G6]|uniref:choice-of-anchor L domain-containing protein n=1 Tax=Moorena sp. SIO1G6 TaxID=2607840 RepID=UPI0013C1832B|nr:choice-of-anchor L domain-containing protein [Moorena sp. SIO1G6]NET68177.1 hypothetical protein [Moorena sp. SIO1G6]